MLDEATRDRALGAILGSATGDALGAPCEFQPPLPSDDAVVMRAGGAFDWELGEWTDDTSMAVPILRALADGRELADESTLDLLVATWAQWASGAKDVGNQIRAVLGSLESPTAEAARAAARTIHDQAGRSGGNGSLMRTGPVALAFLGGGQEERLVHAARAISDLTHFDAETGDACVLWSLAIRHAIRTGEIDVHRGIRHVPFERRETWLARFDEAERLMPWQFPQNGWVVHALQASWSAIAHAETLERRLVLAVRCGNDTDTVAAIAGALAGAAAGASSIPDAWRRELHGWSGPGEVATAAHLEAWVERATAYAV
ncbi:ADP-ribosylglycohydrolase family protein [Agrococcus jejuensis]|uniref:ADP-ribosylglycohydrolase n=1 Tax=Agrococcus jejuensis TaxID=399736 RepID=A0A1G8CHH4_9MICO|nr:ADP-ribosylglycohydrolase family protein [Agrococcus jejuensis]SDH44683.1 ADP-ribosylglycohydrolase [Agrococcus jejuensis]